MIYTVTLNPAFDKEITVSGFVRGNLNIIKKRRRDLGGKGINVSKILTEMGLENEAIIIAGENDLEEVKKELKKYGIKNRIIINNNSYTRENIKLYDENSHEITEINEKGNNIPEKIFSEFNEYYKNSVCENDIIILSGSLPPDTDENIYFNLIKTAKERKSHVILDTSGKRLEKALKAFPDLIKPNEKEISEILYGNITKNIEKIRKDSINMLISMGEKGFLYISEKEEWKVSSFEVNVKNTVGAGDSLLAGFIYGITKTGNTKEALKYARACATAKVTTEGSGIPDSGKINFYYKNEGIERL
ncbi:MAG TPA: 1-phosphofructokinase family hexose kinase [Tepiditoga sp.]|nr:1-phosphofructokinase family hexose kinase [Thermotogota bacterium]HOO75424.1 1-phosphofructokinase family hexose kinase [Tepiditoga sp.]